MQIGQQSPDESGAFSVHIDTCVYLEYTENLKRLSKLYGYLLGKLDNTNKSIIENDIEHEIIRPSIHYIKSEVREADVKLASIIDNFVREQLKISEANNDN